ncbi:MAG: D-alanyl-D-alanine carboxypeptidase [Desulfobacterales bacterium]|nr:D-alanyl-D-alanine carboxypeptidase [Desulfobacterales bacterium]
MKNYTYKSLIFFCLFSVGTLQPLQAARIKDIDNLIGSRDAVLVTDSRGRTLISKNADKKLIPASTLKILTALVAMHYLGPEYRFATEFYIDKDSNLKVKGYGDPLFISEILPKIAKTLSLKVNKFRDLILDDSYFENPLKIPGITSSFEPYDAPNGALCTNFNTIFFKLKSNGTYISAEDQTPLLSFSLDRITKSSLNQGRIVLSHQKNEITLYTGYLLKYFLQQEGLHSNGKVLIGRIQEENDTLIFTYHSKFSLPQVISKLLEYSNNFMANQLLIAAGAKVYGPPATLDKGVRAALSYAQNVLNLQDIRFVEGSGISRANRISANAMHQILAAFEPYHLLMRRMGNEFFKTGTLKGITTRVGYIKNGRGELNRFVLLINSASKNTKQIIDKILLLIHS